MSEDTTFTAADDALLRQWQRNGGTAPAPSRPKAPKLATRSYVDQRIKALGEGAAAALGEIVRELRGRIDQLEERTSNFKYVGVFEDAKTYVPGNFVTHDGSLWHCNASTQSKPGSDSSWVLAVKRGKDGHDAVGGNDSARRSGRSHR